jgi:hypothetical protein
VNVQHHRPMKPGPEAVMMNAVFEWSRTFTAAEQCWTASSIPVGAGMPDFILATYRPEITRLTTTAEQHAGVLAYLRLVRSATPQTIAERIGHPLARISDALDSLHEAKAIEQRGDSFRLTTRWRQILPKTIAIEAKVSDWRKAVEQASRNTIFVHYSYVAFPEPLAERVSVDTLFDQLGIGVMGIAKSGELRIVRRAPRTNPIAWYYYYNLALTLSRTHERRRCPSKFPSTRLDSTSPITPS